MLLVSPPTSIEFHILFSLLVCHLLDLAIFRIIVLWRWILSNLFKRDRCLFNRCQARVWLCYLLLFDVNNLVLAIHLAKIVTKYINIIVGFLFVHKSHLLQNLLLLTQIWRSRQIVLVHEVLALLELGLQKLMAVNRGRHHTRWHENFFFIVVWLAILLRTLTL